MKSMILEQTITTHRAGTYKTYVDVYDRETGELLKELEYVEHLKPLKHAAITSMVQAVKSVREEYGDDVEITFLTNAYEFEHLIAKKTGLEHHFDVCEDDGCGFCASLYEEAV